MDQKKVKHPVVRAVIHYVFVAIVLAAIIVAYLFSKQLNDLFVGDPNAVTPVAPIITTNIDAINNVLRFIPTLIHCIEIAGLMYLGILIVDLLGKISVGLTFKSKTLYKVILSIIKWIVIVGGIIAILFILGVDATALLISAGVITLVVGLSAQNLISDVLAGLFIVIEGEYLIDDIVVIDGWRGKVKSVDIRTTSIEDIGGNVKIINNSEIKTVVNLTNHKSQARVTVYIASSEDLRTVEKVFGEHLAEFKEQLKEYQIGDIIYKGVTSIDGNGMAMLYMAECFEEDIYVVERTLNRLFKYVMDDNNFSGNEPLVVLTNSKNFPVTK